MNNENTLSVRQKYTVRTYTNGVSLGNLFDFVPFKLNLPLPFNMNVHA